MARKRLSDEKLGTLLSKAISDSESYTDGKLSKERTEVRKYYSGELPAPLHKGDSKYVSRDVFDTVDSMRSTVLESFLAHTRIVNFSPERGETVDDARQATDFTRHVFFKDNDGEQIMYEALSDGLQNRFSLTKVYAEDVERTEEYEFEGLTPEELFMEVEQYEDYEIDEYEYSESGLLSGTFSVTEQDQRVVVETVQPEDLMVSSRAPSLSEADYIIHRTEKSRSDMIELYGKDAIKGVSFGEQSDLDHSLEKQERFEDIGDMFGPDGAVDKSNEVATVYEVYIKLDMYQDGQATKWKIVYCNDKVIDREQVSRWPFASFVPIPKPHTFYGENYASSVIPVQNARTVLIRQIINHSLITNNPRQKVLNGTVQNPKELVDNRLGGIVNVRRMDGIEPVMQQPLNPYVFNLIGMIDEDKEETTGISKLSQGMNKDAISTQNAEGMVEQLISQSQQRQKIIARRFGKYVRELFHLIYHVAIDHIDQASFVDALGSYVDVNPTDWKERNAASVELALGYGEQAKEAQKWAEIDQYFMNDPMLNHAYGYERRYEVLQRGMQARGVEDLNAILTPPDQMQPPEPSESEVMQMELQKAQIEYQKAQTQSMIGKTESDRIKAEADAMKVKMDALANAKSHGLEVEKFIHSQDMDRLELALSETADKSTATYSYNQ